MGEGLEDCGQGGGGWGLGEGGEEMRDGDADVGGRVAPRWVETAWGSEDLLEMGDCGWCWCGLRVS